MSKGASSLFIYFSLLIRFIIIKEIKNLDIFQLERRFVMEFMIKFWITCLIYLVFIFYPAKKRVLEGFIENKKDLKRYIVVDFFVYVIVFTILTILIRGTIGGSESIIESASRNFLALLVGYGLTYFSLKSYYKE